MTAALKDLEFATLEAEMRRIGDAARGAARALAIASPESKTRAIQAAAKAIRARSAEIVAASAGHACAAAAGRLRGQAPVRPAPIAALIQDAATGR